MNGAKAAITGDFAIDLAGALANIHEHYDVDHVTVQHPVTGEPVAMVLTPGQFAGLIGRIDALIARVEGGG